MRHIKDIVKNFTDNMARDKAPEKGMILKEKWGAIAGSFADKSEPHMLKGNKLFIYAQSSVIMSEMVYKKEEMLKNINKILKKPEIKELVIRIKQ